MVNLSGTRLYDGTVNAANTDLSVASGTVGTETLQFQALEHLMLVVQVIRTINNTGSLSLGNGDQRRYWI